MAWFACRLFAFRSQRVSFNLVRPQLAGRIYAMMERNITFYLRVNKNLVEINEEGGASYIRFDAKNLLKSELVSALLAEALIERFKEIVNQVNE